MDNYFRPTVTAAIDSLFVPAEREIITELLIEECNAKHLRTTSADALERIQLAVIKISEGDVDKFLAAARTAQMDWRDVLVMAGFGYDLKAHLKWVEQFHE